jgi:ligand-binding sensor domain-containing protein/serine phosphatase RsbU (regulator of sigma subunit)
MQLAVISTFGQTFFFDKQSIDKGLSSSKVYAVHQDKHHLVWLGTPTGVSTYDGLKFENFSSENGLAPGGVKSIFEDSKGQIWFGHLDGGLTRYNGENFESLPINILKKDISGFCEDNEGKIWVASFGSGAILISNPTAPLQNLKYEQYQGKRLSDLVFGCLKLHNGSLLFITDVGVKIFNPKANNFDNYSPDGMTNYFQITSMFEDRQQNIWFGTYHGGLYKFSEKEQTFKIYDIRDGLASNWISCITEDHAGIVWVGTWGGGITRICNNKLTTFSKTNGLADNNIFCLKEDIEGNLLVGTAGEGLSIYKGEGLVGFTQKDILPNPQVWAITSDAKNNIWFGTPGGIGIYKPNAPEENQYQLLPANDAKLIPANIRCMKTDPNGNIWIGTDDGLYSFNNRKQTFEFPLLNGRLPDRNRKIPTINVDQKGMVWIGSFDGLFYLNPITNDAGRLSQENGLGGNEVTCIYIDRDNTKYIGIRGKGITVFKDELTLKSPHYELLGNTTVLCITSDKLGQLWVGTEGQGLLCVKDGKVMARYTQQKDGLLSDLINFVATDNNDDIYAGTNRGLNRFHSKKAFFVYTERNGFSGIEAKPNAIFHDGNGCLWMGTVSGAFRFDPVADQTPTNEPFTMIRGIAVNLTKRSLKNKAEFNYTENAVIIDFASISLNNPDAVQYQFKLEGADNDWQPLTRETSARYSALQPSHYTFKVKAKNSAGIWSQPVEYSFTIAPPFYKTWWFTTICIILSAIIIIVYIKIRERKLIREKNILEDTVRERTAEVVQANHELANKNRDILDSIQYASRIQKALMPPGLPFKDTFILFRPKDIVSGDFFWFVSNGNKEWFAAADCTGHGVPGAFMTIIGVNSLNQIVKELEITEPGTILKRLNYEVTRTLHQYAQGEQIRDGMDIALICYDRETRRLEYAGAFNPLWLCRRGELIDIKATRQPIGMAGETEAEKNFQNNVIDIEPGDTILIFSDGYADQFGGPDQRKMKVGTFREYFRSIQNHPMDEQKRLLEKFLDDWQGDTPQIDDILVIGRRFE